MFCDNPECMSYYKKKLISKQFQIFMNNIRRGYK